MKKTLLFLLASLGTLAMAQQPARVEVRVEDRHFYLQTGNEWIAKVYADLFDSEDNLLEPSSGYLYVWESMVNESGQWTPEAGGYGMWTTTLDGNVGEVHNCRVIVKVSELDSLVSDGNAVISLAGTPIAVYFFAKKDDNTALLGVTLQNFTDPHWDYPGFNVPSTVEPPNPEQVSPSIYVRKDHQYEYMRSTPFATTDLTRKFRFWKPNQSDDLNHDQMTISTSSNILRPEYKSIYGATVNAQFVGGGAGPTVDFRDPWFIDYMDSSRGLRNRGQANAAWYSQTFFDLSTSGSHQGVFLNQPLVAGQPHYSVRVPIMQTIQGTNYEAIFQGWSYNPSYAELGDIAGESTPGYDQKGVVFKLAGASVTALYTTSNITTSVTIPAGTYTMAGTLTVASGATLTLSPGTTLQFPASTKLIVNGVLIANGTPSQRINFTKSGTSTWTGLEFSGANGSSITYANISYAVEPVKVTSTSSFTMCQDSIRNASFSINGALQFYGSNPTISYVVIKGQSGASNGVRFASSSTGSITNSTIRDLSAGNGIVVQGNSTPLIRSNRSETTYIMALRSTTMAQAVPPLLSQTAS